MRLVSTLVVVLFSANAFGVSSDCAKQMGPATAKAVRAYMLKNGLIRPDEEQKFPDLGIDVRWELTKVVSVGAKCFAVEAICSTTAGKKECGQAYEVMALVKSPRTKKYEVMAFEKVQVIPSSAVAKIGLEPGNSHQHEKNYYYALLSGADVLAATKSIVAKAPYFGFSGVVSRDGRASFDPSPNRDWKVSKANFDLRRGLTAEVLDISSYQLDGLDEEGADGYFSGCNQSDGKPGTCEVAPWAQAFVLELLAP